MKELKIINQQEVLGKDFKVYGDFDNPLFLAKDVAMWIEHSNPSVMVANIDEDEKTTLKIGTLNNAYTALFLTEDGLYEVLMQSRKPIAKQFKKQVKRILKEIRTKGEYSVVPKTLKEALYLAYKQQEQIEILELENKELERTKAWISDKKTATAMNTASQKAKEVNRLKIELDRSKEYASIKAVEKATKNKYKWQLLRNYCTSHELEMKKVFDPNFGAVNTYPAEAWLKVYGIDLIILFD